MALKFGIKKVTTSSHREPTSSWSTAGKFFFSGPAYRALPKTFKIALSSETAVEVMLSDDNRRFGILSRSQLLANLLTFAQRERRAQLALGFVSPIVKD